MEARVKSAINFAGLSTTPSAADSLEISDDEYKKIRKGFIRKVYATLTVQVVIAASIFAFAYLYEPAKNLMTNVYFRWTCYGITATLLIPILCIPKVRKLPILNLILLMIFTITASIILTEVSFYFETNPLLLAIGITVAVCLGLTLFAVIVKWDFTKIPVYICVFQTILVVLLIAVFCVRSDIFTFIFSTYGVLVLCLSLVYDTQLLQVGKRRYFYLMEEYTFAAWNLYIDIFIMCVFLLQLI